MGYTLFRFIVPFNPYFSSFYPSFPSYLSFPFCPSFPSFLSFPSSIFSLSFPSFLHHHLLIFSSLMITFPWFLPLLQLVYLCYKVPWLLEWLIHSSKLAYQCCRILIFAQLVSLVRNQKH